MKKQIVIFTVLFILSLIIYINLSGEKFVFKGLFDTQAAKDDAFDMKSSTLNLKKDNKIFEKQKVTKDVGFLEENFTKGYHALQTAKWSYESDILKNGNISILLKILQELEISEWPATSYYNVSSGYVKQNFKECLGERFWFNEVYIDQIEFYGTNSKYAQLLNVGESFDVIHGHCENGDQWLMFIMSSEGVEDYYKDAIKAKHRNLNISNMQGWYVGTLNNIPVFCLPKLYGG